MQTDVAAHQSHFSGDDDRSLTSVFSAYVASATLWLLFATGVGLVIAYKFCAPEFGPGAWLTLGRLRPIHTNATFYGFASIALVGLGYYVAVRSCGTKLYRASLAWTGLVLFNVAAIAGTVALDLGYNDGDLEYREWPWWIRLIFVAALAVTAWNLIATIARRSGEEIYLSNWYITGGTLWTCIIAVVGVAPWYQYGLGQVSVSGYYMHNAVGMWFTPLALGMIYYTLPKLLNRPIYSYALGVFAFWTNLVFYPIIGAHHFLFSPLPWWLQTIAIVFSVAMLVPVWGGSSNFLLTMRGGTRDVVRSYPLMFIFVGVMSYLIGSTEGTLEALRSLQEVWHLTSFTVAHSHLTMYGIIVFAIWGGVYALLPLATGKRASQRGMALHFWMALVGFFIYVMSLSIGGTIQGLDWMRGLPFIQSVVDMQTYYLWRGVGGSLMFLSHIVFAWNVWRMCYGRGGLDGVVVPTHKAEALIAYLASLKQPPLLGAEVASGEPAMVDMADSTTTASATTSDRMTSPDRGYDAAKGATLFAANCAACHQANGEGLPGAFPSLKDNAAVNDDDATMHIQVVLHGLHDTKVGGVAYASAMPPFSATLSDAEAADIIDYERSSWGNHSKPVVAAQVAAERAKAK